jgi:Arc/MetJ family transcription regulator
MATRLIIDGDLIARARKVTGIDDAATIIHEALRTLIVREAARRLAALGVTEPGIEPIPRRRACVSS